MFSEGQLAPLRSLTDAICEHFADRGQYDPFTKYFLPHRTDQGALFDLYFRHPEYRFIAHEPKILDVLEGVLGPNVFLYENSLVYKPRAANNAVPWHQDYINRSDEPTKYVVWAALDDVRIDNGAMKVIPGSHKLGFQRYFTVPGETHHTRLQLEGVDVSKYQYVEVGAGDVLIFHQLLLHSSDQVDNPSKRRAFRFACQGFETIFSPRAVPVVLRGGQPGRLPHFQAPAVPPDAEGHARPRPLFRRAINKVGRYLARL